MNTIYSIIYWCRYRFARRFYPSLNYKQEVEVLRSEYTEKDKLIIRRLM